jgi:hypothetical protein
MIVLDTETGEIADGYTPFSLQGRAVTAWGQRPNYFLDPTETYLYAGNLGRVSGTYMRTILRVTLATGEIQEFLSSDMPDDFTDDTDDDPGNYMVGYMQPYLAYVSPTNLFFITKEWGTYSKALDQDEPLNEHSTWVFGNVDLNTGVVSNSGSKNRIGHPRYRFKPRIM